MKCPVCKTHEMRSELDLHATGFSEDIVTCNICGATWAVSHGAVEMISDPQEYSFLSAVSESVEGYDYSYAA